MKSALKIALATASAFTLLIANDASATVRIKFVGQVTEADELADKAFHVKTGDSFVVTYDLNRPFIPVRGSGDEEISQPSTPLMLTINGSPVNLFKEFYSYGFLFRDNTILALSAIDLFTNNFTNGALAAGQGLFFNLVALDLPLPDSSGNIYADFSINDGRATGSASYYFREGPLAVSDGQFRLAAERVEIFVLPEPATWTMMIAGFGMVGGATRLGKRGVRRELRARSNR